MIVVSENGLPPPALWPYRWSHGTLVDRDGQGLARLLDGAAPDADKRLAATMALLAASPDLLALVEYVAGCRSTARLRKAPAMARALLLRAGVRS